MTYYVTSSQVELYKTSNWFLKTNRPCITLNLLQTLPPNPVLDVRSIQT